MKSAYYAGAIADALQPLVLDELVNLCDDHSDCEVQVDEKLLPFLPPSPRGTLVITYSCEPLPTATSNAAASPQSAPFINKVPSVQVSKANAPQGGVTSWSRSITSHLTDVQTSSTAEGTGLVSAAALVAERNRQLQFEFLTIPHFKYKCTSPLAYQPARLSEPLSLADATAQCSKDVKCSLVVVNSTNSVEACGDQAIEQPRFEVSSEIRVKGTVAATGASEDFVVFLNHQAVCEDDSILWEADGVTSTAIAAAKCRANPDCAHFVLTTESGLQAAGSGSLGPVPNHLWLCGPTTTSASISEETDENVKVPQTLGVKYVPSPGVITGYRPAELLEMGMPVTLQ